MKALRTASKVLLLTMFAAWLPSSGAADFTMKLAHAAAPGDPRDDGAKRVAEILNAKNSCNLKVQVYPSSQLGGSNDLIQQLQLGTVEAALLPASFLVGFQPLLGIMDLPYFLPDDPQKLLKVHQSKAMKDLLATTASKGVMSLSVWHTGYKEWTGPHPMVTLKDYKGVNVRVMPSQVLAEQNRLLGLQSVSMDFGETYSALQNGAIKGQDNPITTIFFMKFHEVQKYMTMTDHGTLDQIFMVAKGFWDRLPASCQSELQQAADAGAKVSFDRTYQAIDKALKAFERTGMKVVPMTAEQKAVLAKATRPARDFYVKQTGKQGQAFIDAFEAEMARINK